MHFYRVTYLEREGDWVHAVIQAPNAAAAKKIARERFDDVYSVKRIHAWAKIITVLVLLLVGIVYLIAF